MTMFGGDCSKRCSWSFMCNDVWARWIKEIGNFDGGKILNPFKWSVLIIKITLWKLLLIISKVWR